MLHRLALMVVEQLPNHATSRDGPLTQTTKISSLGEVGLGINNYNALKKIPTPTLRKTAASINYSPSAASIPTPPAFPKIPAPSLSVPTPGSKPKSSFPSTPKLNTSASVKVSTESSAFPIAAGVGGGIGGWALGSKVIVPMLEKKITKITEELAKKEQTLGRWQELKKAAPLGGAIAGALLLAALASWNMRRVARQSAENRQIRLPYDQSGGAFSPHEKMDFDLSTPREFY